VAVWRGTVREALWAVKKPPAVGKSRIAVHFVVVVKGSGGR